jgi:hypothetical protein
MVDATGDPRITTTADPPATRRPSRPQEPQRQRPACGGQGRASSAQRRRCPRKQRQRRLRSRQRPACGSLGPWIGSWQPELRHSWFRSGPHSPMPRSQGHRSQGPRSQGHRSWPRSAYSTSWRAGRAAIPQAPAGPRSMAPTNLDHRREASLRRAAARAPTGAAAAHHGVAGAEAGTGAPAPHSATQTRMAKRTTIDQSVPDRRPRHTRFGPLGLRLRLRHDLRERRCHRDVARRAGIQGFPARRSRPRLRRPEPRAPFAGADRPCRSASPTPIRTGSAVQVAAQILRLRRPRQ